jgi:hypothetical protein
MKPKVILLAVGLLGFAAAKANGDDPGAGTCLKGKKDDLNGTVTHSDSKKPLKDVTVTAFLVSKKEKIVLTDEEGGFAFDELKPGTYKFVFEKAGFKKVTKEKIVVKTDEAFQLNIEMIESTSYDLMPSPFHFSDF